MPATEGYNGPIQTRIKLYCTNSAQVTSFVLGHGDILSVFQGLHYLILFLVTPPAFFNAALFQQTFPHNLAVEISNKEMFGCLANTPIVKMSFFVEKK